MPDSPMLVRDLMERDVVTLDASDSLDLADDIMRLGRIRHMPVLSNSRLAGILSQRDLFRAAISSVLQLRPAAEREWLAKTLFCAFVSKSLITTAMAEAHPTAR